MQICTATAPTGMNHRLNERVAASGSSIVSFIRVPLTWAQYTTPLARPAAIIICMDPLLLDGESLAIENLHQVALDRRRVALHPEALQKMARSRAVIDAIVRDNRVV